MNWGLRITIIYTGFVLLIITMVVRSMNQKIDLVSEDYYARELKFQDKIERIRNEQALKEIPVYTIQGDELRIQFPSEFKDKTISGKLLFFKPSDSSKDVQMSIQLNEKNQQLINTSQFSKGMYKMQLEWEAVGVKYFHEETIIISVSQRSE
jgi:nitrogen fixation protein FixH